MWGKSEIVVSALLLSLSVASPALAKKPKPTPCPPDRYLLPSGISSLTGDSGTEDVPLVLGSGQSSLGSCSLKSTKSKANKKGITTIIAKSPPGTTCNGFKKVVVHVSLQSGCQSATIKVKAKKFPLQTLQATRSFCGDGKIDMAGGEECDGSGCPATATCDATCKCAPIPVTTTTTSVATTSTSPTSITATTTTTTTTTTMIGVCLDANGHATAQQCGLNRDCPLNGNAYLPCCGNLVTDIGETCDKGRDNCADGTLCGSDCTSECRAIGRCTGGASGLISPPQACVLASDCGAGEGCCGNKIVDTPAKITDPPIETCDDGNFTQGPGDSCPAACFEPACTPVSESAVGIHVTFIPPAGKTISGLSVFVTYPEGKVAAPGNSPQHPVFGVSLDLNDLSYAFTANAVKSGGLPTAFANLVFETCDGASAPTPGDFNCTVTDASDDDGNVVDPSTLTCGVTVP
jgi:hypothetical protein